MSAIPLHNLHSSHISTLRAHSNLAFQRYRGLAQRQSARRPSQRGSRQFSERCSLKTHCNVLRADEEPRVKRTQSDAVQIFLRRGCKLAAYSLAIWAWLNFSAGRSATRFCSSSLAAAPSNPGQHHLVELLVQNLGSKICLSLPCATS